MSVTFSISGVGSSVDDPTSFLNTSNTNAAELLSRLKMPAELVGDMRAIDLIARCKKALERAESAQDVGLPAASEDRYHFCGRPPGRINDNITALLKLCEKAGDLGRIVWG